MRVAEDNISLDRARGENEISIEIPDGTTHIVPVYRIGDTIVEESVWRDVVQMRQMRALEKIASGGGLR